MMLVEHMADSISDRTITQSSHDQTCSSKRRV